MTEQKTIYLPADIAPNVIRISDDLTLKDYLEKIAIIQAKSELMDEVTLVELGFKGKPDLSKIKVEYPITFELQEDSSAKCRIPVSVPCLNDNG